MGNANLSGRPTIEQQKSLPIVRIILSVPSLLGSAFIIQDILRSPKRRGRVFAQLMLSMSSMDFLYAIYSVASALPCPRELPIFLAVGSWKSCEAFGFIGQASKMASILYNGGLALYFLLTIRYGWAEQKSRRRIVIPIQMLCQGIAWGTAIAALRKDLYNPTPIGCQIYPFPGSCEMLGTPCIRGGNAATYQLALFLYPVLVIFAWLVASMAMIYCKIAQVESVMLEREGITELECREGRPLRITSLRRGFATQALLYCIAFFLSWIFAVVGACIVEFQTPPEFYFPIAALSVSMSSLQGFFTACIYIRPRYLRYRRKTDSDSTMEQTSAGMSPSSSRMATTISALGQALSVQALDDEDEFEEIEEHENGSINENENIPSTTVKTAENNNTMVDEFPSEAENG